MGRLADEIKTFLQDNDLQHITLYEKGFNIIQTWTNEGSKKRIILPFEISATNVVEAENKSRQAVGLVQQILIETGEYPLIITEDRWRRHREMMKKRLLAHLEIFRQAYARNCEVRRIDKVQAQSFLADTHSYGDASCRYRYGLFLKRYTGASLKGIDKNADTNNWREREGTLVAVATFSNARRWIKDGKVICSYEWTRYASLPDFRINGGMGKVLKAFIEDVNPDDIMSYADLEWSTGTAYQNLGFTLEGYKDPVTFGIKVSDWSRKPVSSDMEADFFFRNFGSNKYRLKLTDYQ